MYQFIILQPQMYLWRPTSEGTFLDFSNFPIWKTQKLSFPLLNDAFLPAVSKKYKINIWTLYQDQSFLDFGCWSYIIGGKNK